MEVNLSARGEGNGCALFQNRIEMMVEGQELTLFPGPAETFAVRESSDVRVIVEAKGRLTTATGDFPGEEFRKDAAKIGGRTLKGLARPGYATQFTVYPTGRIFIRHVLEFEGQPVELTSNHMVLATSPVGRVEAFNERAAKETQYLSPVSYLVHYGTDREFPASALFVVNMRRYPTDWLGQMMTFDAKRQGWVRSAFSVQSGRRVVKPGKYVWNFMLQIEPTGLHSREAASAYVLDYLNPARITFLNAHGSADLGDNQDEQLDGFAEGRGCYIVSADGKPLVEMQVDAGMQSRFCPAFEIKAWKGPAPRSITVDGELRRSGVHYQAHMERDTLVMQYLAVFSPGVHTLKVDARASDADEN
jgi:hypothetical protein